MSFRPTSAPVPSSLKVSVATMSMAAKVAPVTSNEVRYHVPTGVNAMDSASAAASAVASGTAVASVAAASSASAGTPQASISARSAVSSFFMKVYLHTDL